MKVQKISRSEVPQYEEPQTYRTILKKLIEPLSINEALSISCRHHGEAHEIRSWFYSYSNKIRKEQSLKLSYQIYEPPLSEKQQLAYDECPHKGHFPRTVILYVWKEFL